LVHLLLFVGLQPLVIFVKLTSFIFAESVN